jgi:hypothetical protein
MAHIGLGAAGFGGVQCVTPSAGLVSQLLSAREASRFCWILLTLVTPVVQVQPLQQRQQIPMPCSSGCMYFSVRTRRVPLALRLRHGLHNYTPLVVAGLALSLGQLLCCVRRTASGVRM